VIASSIIFFSPKYFRSILLLLIVARGDHHASVTILGVVLNLMTQLISCYDYDMIVPSSYHCCASNLLYASFCSTSEDVATLIAFKPKFADCAFILSMLLCGYTSSRPIHCFLYGHYHSFGVWHFLIFFTLHSFDHSCSL
jgi:hypothetical protein